MKGSCVTVAVPSLNQALYLDEALNSLFSQDVPVEVFVADGGSTDDSLDVIRRWEDRLAGWRSHPDQGQSAAINECIARGTAEYVCWLNSDDYLLPDGLERLCRELNRRPECPAVYGRAWHEDEAGRRTPVWVEPFDEWRLAVRCIVSQPATLIRRSAWEAVGGLDPELEFAMDYDLWWKLYRSLGPLAFVDLFVAINRDHRHTKTRARRKDHHREAMAVVRRHYGRVPLKWRLAYPYSVWFRTIVQSWK